jgi:tripartite-type tricarboxylate transporter receptor subunit TctC
MQHRRRVFLRLAAGAASVVLVPRIAPAQSYPAKPVRVIVAVPAGGPIDLAARLIGQWLSERLGQVFVIENRPGAGNNIGTESVARAAGDGYTLLVTAAAAAINATLFDKLSYNFLRDFAPVAGINHIPLVLTVHPTFPVMTVAELIAFAKANPGKVNMATPGLATAPDLACELFKMMTGTDIVTVRYRGSSPVMTDLIGGQVHAAFDAVPTSIDHVRTGGLRAHSRSRARPASTSSRTFRRSRKPCRASRPAAGVGFAHPGPRRLRSSIS